ncbi:MAG TPA: hypothetical protein VGE39_26855 [Prosthecobacter sp.]
MPSSPQPTQSPAEECRRLFKPKLKRGEVLALGERYGISKTTMRALIEGAGAPVKREVYGGQTRGYFDREQLIRQLFREA